jgi:hypothetical protein
MVENLSVKIYSKFSGLRIFGPHPLFLGKRKALYAGREAYRAL